MIDIRIYQRTGAVSCDWGVFSVPALGFIGAQFPNVYKNNVGRYTHTHTKPEQRGKLFIGKKGKLLLDGGRRERGKTRSLYNLGPRKIESGNSRSKPR